MHVQMDFDSFGLDERLTRSLRDSRILAPTTVQRASIPVLIEGRDLAMQAGSGTGRVLAFCLPAINRMLAARDGGTVARAVIVTTDTGSAMRVHSDIKRATRHAPLGVLIPAAGVERTPASYGQFGDGVERPDVLVGPAPAVAHFLRGTGYPMDGTAVFAVLAATQISADDREAIASIMGGLPGSCQRIAVGERGEDLEAMMEIGLLRSPAMVMDAGGAPRPDAPVEPPAPPPVEESVLGPRRNRSIARRTPRDRPETWPGSRGSRRAATR